MGRGLVERFMDDLDNLFLLNYQTFRDLNSLKKAILTDLGCLFDLTNTATKENFLRRYFIAMIPNGCLYLLLPLPLSETTWGYWIVSAISLICLSILYAGAPIQLTTCFGVIAILIVTCISAHRLLEPAAIAGLILCCISSQSDEAVS